MITVLIAGANSPGPEIGAPEMAAILKKASSQLPGTQVVKAELTQVTVPTPNGNSYSWPTVGVLRFSEPQSTETLDAAVKLVADILEAENFEVKAMYEYGAK
ncbi:hypothetical protein [Myxococcus xanthus]|uniref:Uncharacterized protein n=1 Tax=Myxococcus xanthus TaxID=34 RepID=A0A7Y4MSE4_MYXXA|nr:hypothetical protein [Myxococcus xanthus]NOJ80397.1 hypothetical protein [Myxococcus xanthus]NOJ84930.1 hypothetical protein [Myxococcus xanthus]